MMKWVQEPEAVPDVMDVLRQKNDWRDMERVYSLEQHTSIDSIEKIENVTEKEAANTFFRNLWSHCFDDPEAYEDFYFSQVYPDNVVYAIKEKGMLHLNPYLCSVLKTEYMLHYIVGVGTHVSQRRKGIMRQLLEQALWDMYGKKEPFTYLMPADVRYYEPFGFVSISSEEENVCCKVFEKTEKKIHFLSYKELEGRFTERQRNALFSKTDHLLKEQYQIYAVHDAGYFQRLFYEKYCQGGDVVFCFEEEEFCGFFAYAVDGERRYVEQYVLEKEEQLSSCLGAYFDGKECIVCRFPFMLRVVHVETFLNLFSGCFLEFLDEGKALQVKDVILTGNDGIYRFVKKGNAVCCIREEDTQMPVVHMTTADLAEYVSESGIAVYFAEIV
ncbi:MAG: GNAT family N-acetyltransferase [Lachnospiraceae bacterium]